MSSSWSFGHGLGARYSRSQLRVMWLSSGTDLPFHQWLIGSVQASQVLTGSGPYGKSNRLVPAPPPPAVRPSSQCPAKAAAPAPLVPPSTASAMTSSLAAAPAPSKASAMASSLAAAPALLVPSSKASAMTSSSAAAPAPLVPPSKASAMASSLTLSGAVPNPAPRPQQYIERIDWHSELPLALVTFCNEDHARHILSTVPPKWVVRWELSNTDPRQIYLKHSLAAADVERLRNLIVSSRQAP
jgi:hypothetical protein